MRRKCYAVPADAVLAEAGSVRCYINRRLAPFPAMILHRREVVLWDVIVG